MPDSRLDRLALQEHGLLQGRHVVDDPDSFELDCPADTRRHGTAMASLILRGDLGAHEQPLPRRLYDRPILRTDLRDGMAHNETVPEGTLVVDAPSAATGRIFRTPMEYVP